MKPVLARRRVASVHGGDEGTSAVTTGARAVGESASTAQRIAGWMDRNLAIQGYRLGADEHRRLGLGLRFSTGLCLPLVALALVLESPLALVALSVIAFVAGFTPRHPFDLVWNHAVRRPFGAPPLPPSPVRRRHAFKVGFAWLLAVAGLFSLGATAAGLALGGLLLLGCSLTTFANLCVPSYLMWLYGSARARREQLAPGS